MLSTTYFLPYSNEFNTLRTLHLKLFITGDNPEPVCMDVLVGFGQLCARFVGNSSTPKDFDGCLKLEATLLNEVQNSIPMGCFKMDQHRLIFNST